MNLTKRNLLIFSFVVLLIMPSFVLVAQNEGTEQDQPTVVATVNEKKITQQELSQAAQLRQVYMMAMQRQLPQRFTQFLFSHEQGRKFIKEYQKFVLDILIDKELQAQKIEELGITATKKEVQKTVDQQIKSIIERNKKIETEEDIKKAVESQGKQSYEGWKKGLREQVRQRILDNKLREEVTSGVEVTEEEMKTFYEKNEQSYTTEDGTVKPFEKVKDKIKSTLMEQKKNEAWTSWLNKAREEATIEKNLEVLGS